MNPTQFFAQKYPIDLAETDFIKVRWNKSYTLFEFYHNDTLISTCNSSAELKKGITTGNTEIPDLFIRIIMNPFGFEVRKGKRFLKKSRILAKEKLTSMATIFFFLGAMGSIAFYGVIRSVENLNPIFIYVSILVLACYFVAGFLIKKGRVSAYFFGISLLTIYTILSFIVGALPLINLVFLAIALSQIKYSITLWNHNVAQAQFMSNKNKEDLLDV